MMNIVAPMMALKLSGLDNPVVTIYFTETNVLRVRLKANGLYKYVDIDVAGSLFLPKNKAQLDDCLRMLMEAVKHEEKK